MPTEVYAGVELEVDSEGFLTDHTKWNEELARELAKGEGIMELTPRHFDVIRFMRSEYEAKGEGPSIRALKNRGGVPTRELYELFPGGPAKKAAKIAGIPKPHSCI